MASHPKTLARDPRHFHHGLLGGLPLCAALLCAAGSLAVVPAARAFCGFYVAKADTRLFNRASKVVLVRDGDRTVLSMASDYRGDLEEFALVPPTCCRRRSCANWESSGSREAAHHPRGPADPERHSRSASSSPGSTCAATR